MVVKYRVKMMESDSWSGQKYWTEDFDTYEEAEKRITNVNGKNTALRAPEWYMQAETKIEAVKVDD